MFIVLLSGIVNASNHTECVSLSNKKGMIQPIVINLHPNEYSQEFHYYPFSIRWDRYGGSHNTLLSNKVCIPNKTEDLNLSFFNMITGINGSKTSTKDMSCECKCRFDVTKWNWNQWWNNNKYRCECKKNQVCKKDYVWNPAKYNCESGKYLASIMHDSTIICNELIKLYEEKMKIIPSHSHDKKITCKTQIFYIMLAFLLITVSLLIAVRIYCYMIKYQAKHLLIFHGIKN